MVKLDITKKERKERTKESYRVISLKIFSSDIQTCIDIQEILGRRNKSLSGMISNTLSLLLQNLREAKKVPSYTSEESEALVQDYFPSSESPGKYFAAVPSLTEPLKQEREVRIEKVKEVMRDLRNDDFSPSYYGEPEKAMPSFTFEESLSESENEISESLSEDASLEDENEFSSSFSELTDAELEELFEKEIEKDVQDVKQKEEADLLLKILKEI